MTPDRGITKKHLVFSLNTDTGDINPGWPVDVGEVAVFNGTTFTPSAQAQRPALGIVDNILYVPYGGLFDCTPYHGWLVGVPINNPAGVVAWATSAIGGSVWGVGGVASDGTNPFITTGNTFNTGGNWMGGEAVIRFQPGPIFTGSPADYWAPLNWLTLDNNDNDLGSCGPLLVDVPGATPSALVVAANRQCHPLDGKRLGCIGEPTASSHLSNGSYHPGSGNLSDKSTYAACSADGTRWLSGLRHQPACHRRVDLRSAKYGLPSLRRPMGPITRLYGWSAPNPKAINSYMVTMATLALSFTLVAARTN